MVFGGPRYWHGGRAWVLAWVLAWGQGGVVLVKGVTGMQVADGGAGPPFTTSHFVKRTPNRYKGG